MDAATEISMITTDTDGMIKMFNSGAVKMLVYRSDEIINKHTPALIHLESEVIERGEELSESSGEEIGGFKVFITLPKKHGSETRE